MGAGQLTVVRFTIANGQTVSGEQDCRALQIVALVMPAAWTAATLGFQSRPGLPAGDLANDAYQNVVDDAGAALVCTVNAGTYVTLTGDQLDAMAAAAWLKLVSSTAQGADRSILGVCMPMGA